MGSAAVYFCLLSSKIVSDAMAKAMKAMKKKSVSKIARGRFAKVLVFRGTKVKTVGGLTSEMLIKNKRGKIVSKRQSAAGKRAYNNIKAWTAALVAARKAARQGLP